MMYLLDLLVRLNVNQEAGLKGDTSLSMLSFIL